jgi:hypothetical protein
MKCAVCDQEILTPEAAIAEGLDHHLQRSPVDPDLCLGCWIAFVDLELFFIRANLHRTFWSAQTVEIMRKVLCFAREAKL